MRTPSPIRGIHRALTVASLCIGVRIDAQPARQPRAIVDAALTAASTGQLSAFRTSWHAPGATNDPRLRALALGSADRFAYQFADARRQLSIAEGDTTAPDALTARAALGKAGIELQQFHLKSADIMLDRARRLARRARAPDVDAEALTALVSVRQRTRGVASALATADSAAALLSPTDAALGIELRCRRAQVRVRAGDQDAIVDARAGVAAAARLGLPRLEGVCWQSVGQAHQMRDELRDAAVAFGQAAARHSAANDLAGVSASLQWRGFFHRVLGAFDSAQVDYARAIAAGTTAGNRAPVAWGWLGLSGLSLAAGEPVRAATEAQRAIRSMEEIGDRWGLASASTLAGLSALQLGDLPRARAQLNAGIARSDSLGAIPDMQVPGIALIDVERELDGEAAAMARVAWVDSIAARANNPGWRRERLYRLGILALRRDDGAAALDYFTRFERTFLARDTSRMPSFDFMVRVAEAHARAGDVVRGARLLDVALTTFATWRQSLSSRALRLASWEQRGLDRDPDLGIATIIARTAAAGHDTLAFRLAEARHARDLRATLPSGTRSGEPPAHVVQLRYVTGRQGESTTLFIRRGASLRSAILPPADSLARRIAALQSLLRGNADPGVLARALGEVLLGPAFSAMDAQVNTLVIEPDGVLHGVPWAALTTSDGEPLISQFTIALQPTGGSRRPATRMPGGTLVAFGTNAGARMPDGAPLPPLTRAVEEATMVSQLTTLGRVYAGAAATEAQVRSLAAAPPSIVHFSAHAVVDDRTSARAAILLTPAAGDDGRLDANEIASMHLPVDLVVLAGCSTASGRVLAGEGVQGLLRPLFDAGVRSVVASQWPVRDDVAYRMMEWFYAGLGAGQSTATALRMAQQRARAAGMPAGEWAAWSYIGDADARPGVSITAAPRNAIRWPLLALISTLVVLCLGAAYYRSTTRQVALRI